MEKRIGFWTNWLPLPRWVRFKIVRWLLERTEFNSEVRFIVTPFATYKRVIVTNDTSDGHYQRSTDKFVTGHTDGYWF